MKDNYPAEKYETVFGELWKAMWEEHWDLSKPDKMAECLARHLSNADVKRITEGANTPECKKKLNDTTQRALDTGGESNLFGPKIYLLIVKSLWLPMVPGDEQRRNSRAVLW